MPLKLGGALIALAMTISSLAIGAALIEGGVRLLYDEPPTTNEPVVPNAVKRYDERYGWSLVPSSAGVSRATGAAIRYEINEHGFRGPSRSVAKPAETQRVVLVGDSRTFGWGIPYNQSFGHILEGYVRDVEILNFGVSAFGVDQMGLRLREEALAFAPDLVVVYLPHFGSHRHMHAVRFGRYKPRYELRDGELILTDQPPPWRPAEPSALEAALGRSYALRLIWGDWFDQGDARGPRPPRADARRLREEDEANARNQPFLIRMRRLAEQLLLRMKQESEAVGADFVVMHQAPSLAPFFEEQGVLALDVRRAMANRRFWLSPDLRHVNAAGNGVLAWELYQYVREQRLLCKNGLVAHRDCRRS